MGGTCVSIASLLISDYFARLRGWSDWVIQRDFRVSVGYFTQNQRKGLPKIQLAFQDPGIESVRSAQS